MLRRFAVALAAVVLLLPFPVMTQKAGRPTILLPPDQTVAVITLDFRGGYGPPRRDDRPMLTIFPNGVVRIVDGSGEVAPIEAKISADALQELLRFAIDEHHFLDFDNLAASQQLRAEEDKSGLRHTIIDASTTVIRIRTSERDHTGEFYALRDYLEVYPSVKLLQDLYAVEERLLKLSYEIEAGGEEGIAAALKLANEFLRKTYPTVPLLVPADFLYTRRYSPDRRRLVFVRKAAVRKETETDPVARVQMLLFPEPTFSVTVEYTTGNTPKVMVENPPQ